MRVFACECYTFGAAEYIENADELGNLNVILINSAWYGYMLKHLCCADKVDLFKIGDLMLAFNKHGLRSCLNSSERKTFEKNGCL
jgi:hypothetical protein